MTTQDRCLMLWPAFGIAPTWRDKFRVFTCDVLDRQFARDEINAILRGTK